MAYSKVAVHKSTDCSQVSQNQLFGLEKRSPELGRSLSNSSRPSARSLRHLKVLL